MSAAAWTRTARDLTYDRHLWDDYLTIEQVSEVTGLAPRTLRDTMARPQIGSPDVPRGALCRPAGRIGDMPMWHPDQLADYQARADRAAAAAANKPRLPEVTAAEAAERGLTSIADLAIELGCQRNTLRRIARDQKMPEPVAMAKREGKGVHGRQHELRDRAETLRWIHRYSQAEGGRGRVTVPQHLLDEIAPARLSA